MTNLSRVFSFKADLIHAFPRPVSVQICFNIVYRSFSCFVRCLEINGQKAVAYLFTIDFKLRVNCSFTYINYHYLNEEYWTLYQILALM